ncbi:MAG: Ectoine hydrolase [Gammaproteobacteria bacterium]|nr:Ectoine hydrolase [Gammaproteobacteria bacterium]
MIEDASHPVFPPQELNTRRAKLTAAMTHCGLDGLAIAVPENIYYLTGLDHWGFFSCHMLLVPVDGPMILVARAIERITCENQVSNAEFIGFSDDGDPADATVAGLKQLHLGKARIGLEKNSLFLTLRIAESLWHKTPDIAWTDASGLLDSIRLEQSPLEQAYTRKAARAADAGTLAAIDAVRDGASDYEIAAECHRAMILAGSEYPGFGPFIRPTRRLGEEHTTWRGDTFLHGDAVFLEIGAAYRKYQAPMGRLVFVGTTPEDAKQAAELSIRGMQAICEAARPGATGNEVYQAWQGVADAAGLDHYRRHHCGYAVGIGFPPSWTGGSMVTSLRPGSTLKLKTGMVFHLHSWFTNTGRGDYFVSNTALLTEEGCEILTCRTPQDLQVR